MTKLSNLIDEFYKLAPDGLSRQPYYMPGDISVGIWKISAGERGALVCLPNQTTSLDQAFVVAKDVVLFFDHAALPLGGEGWLGGDLNPLINYLSEVGIYRKFQFEGSDVLDILLKNRDTSSRWSLWNFRESLDRHLRYRGDEKQHLVDSFIIRANNALLVPHRDVSVEDMLEFKQRRGVALTTLRERIESVCIALSRDGTSNFEVNAELERFDRDLAAANELMRKQNWPKSIADLEIAVDMGRLISDVPKATAAVLAGTGFGLTLTQAALAAVSLASCSLKMSKPFTLRSSWNVSAKQELQANPLGYLVSVVHDL